MQKVGKMWQICVDFCIVAEHNKTQKEGEIKNMDNDKVKAQIADKLMLLRAKSELSAREVADRAGINSATVFRYELNKTDINLGVLGKILDVFGVPFSIFFEDIPAKMQKEKGDQ